MRRYERLERKGERREGWYCRGMVEKEWGTGRKMGIMVEQGRDKGGGKKEAHGGRRNKGQRWNEEQ